MASTSQLLRRGPSSPNRSRPQSPRAARPPACEPAPPSCADSLRPHAVRAVIPFTRTMLPTHCGSNFPQLAARRESARVIVAAHEEDLACCACRHGCIPPRSTPLSGQRIAPASGRRSATPADRGLCGSDGRFRSSYDCRTRHLPEATESGRQHQFVRFHHFANFSHLYGKGRANPPTPPYRKSGEFRQRGNPNKMVLPARRMRVTFCCVNKSKRTYAKRMKPYTLSVVGLSLPPPRHRLRTKRDWK